MIKARERKRERESFLRFYFDYNEIVHNEFPMVNKKYYLGILLYFLETILKKRPELWKDHS